MPIYVFEHPQSKIQKEVLLKMSSTIEYVDDNGLKWDRVYTSPIIGVDTRIDPFSKKAFMEKTKKSGTIGDLFDMSKELSEKRGDTKNDPVKKKYSKEWKNKRKQ
jgi:hypothetical protein